MAACAEKSALDAEYSKLPPHGARTNAARQRRVQVSCCSGARCMCTQSNTGENNSFTLMR